MTVSAFSPSMWSPLRQKVFRALWIASAISSIGTWMHDVGAVWLMTSLAPESPLLVALMQSASSLPFFLLALPAGAIADVVDRRKMLLITQTWMMLAAVALSALTLTGLMNPAILLSLTFALGVGAALNMPVWQAIVPELVTREDLPQAVTLSGIVINISRSIGPALAGLVIAVLANPGYVFLINSVSFVATIIVIFQWQRTPIITALPAERVVGAIQAGVRYVRFAPVFQFVIYRTVGYIFFASALFALLPLLGRNELQLDAFGYGLILGFWGLGGLSGAFILPKLRQKYSIDHLVAYASLIMAATMLALAYLRNIYIVYLLMTLVGVSSLSVMVSLNVAAQSALPNWVKARALSVHLLIFQGFMTLGSLLWGTVAQRSSISTTLAVAAVGLLISVFLTRGYRLRCSELLDLRSSLHWEQSIHAFEPCPHDGPVLVTLEYSIDPNNAPAFLAAMKALAQIRRRNGAIQWGVYQDVSVPSRFVETVMIESWLEYQRQYERVTESDRIIEENVRAFHIGDTPPKLSQMVYGNDGKRPCV